MYDKTNYNKKKNTVEHEKKKQNNKMWIGLPCFFALTSPPAFLPLNWPFYIPTVSLSLSPFCPLAWWGLSVLLIWSPVHCLWHIENQGWMENGCQNFLMDENILRPLINSFLLQPGDTQIFAIHMKEGINEWKIFLDPLRCLFSILFSIPHCPNVPQ